MKRKRIRESKSNGYRSSFLYRRGLFCELLEARMVMAVDWGPTMEFSSAVAMEASASEIGSTDTIKTNHYYIADGRPVELIVKPNRIVVGIHDVTQSDPTGLLPDNFQFVRTIRAGVFEYDVPESAGVPSAQQIETLPGIEFTAPVFLVEQTKSEAVALDEIIVAIKPGIDADTYLSSKTQFESYRRLLGTPDQFIVTLNTGYGESTLEMSNQLSKEEAVLWSSPNLYQDWQKYFTPNDPRFANQWHLNNTGQGSGLVDADSDLPEAWDVIQGGSSLLTIGVVDDGVASHPDLDLWVNPGEVPLDGIDNDGNGWVDDINGWNFVTNNNQSGTTQTTDRHATSVAGVAAARGNNAIGVAGVSYNSKVLSAKIFEGSAVASDANIAAALYYAGGRRASGVGIWKSADVVNNSWGGGGPSTAITAALNWGTTQGREGIGATYFFATGNDFGAVSLPASLSPTIPGLIAVGATNNKGERSDYSNFGAEVDLVTPSNDTRGGYLAIDTTDRAGTPGYSSTDYTGTGATGFGGTSSATPLASGIGALVLARAAVVGVSLTPVQMRAFLRNNTDLVGGATYSTSSGKNLEFGFGRLNANSAVLGVGAAEISVTSSTTDFVSGSNTFNFGTVPAGNVPTATFRIRNQGTLPLNLTGLSIAPGPFSIASGFGTSTLNLGESTTFTVQFNSASAGLVSRTVTVLSNDLNEASFTFEVAGTVIAPSVAGTVVEDQDGDGFRDPQDSPLPQRTVFLDSNNNGAVDTLATVTYSNTTPISLPDLATVTSTLGVSGSVGSITDVNVRINVTHTWNADLNFVLISPAGTRVRLFSGVGGSGDNFTNTILDDSAATRIGTGTAPFAGSFIPQDSLAILNGQNANGDWKIEVNDNGPGDTGTLLNWDVIIGTGETSTQTDANGYYSFLGLGGGSYNVRTVPVPDWTTSGPLGGAHVVTLSGTSDSAPGRDFGFGKNNRFYGQVFVDSNSDGIFGSTESGAAARTLLVDTNNNGLLDGSTTTTLSNTTSLAIVDVSTVSSSITASGFANAITDVNLRVNITHGWDSDLDLFLVHPDGTRVELFTDVGSNGANFTNTVLDDSAAVSITSGSAPFTGTFRPEGSLAVLNGRNPNGVWRLELTDDEAQFVGTLNNWDLVISSGESLLTTGPQGNAWVDLVGGTYPIKMQSLSGWSNTIPSTGIRTATTNGTPLFDQRFGTIADVVPPTVSSIIVSGSTWNAPFISGGGNGLGYALTPGVTIANSGIDRIYLQFSEPVVGFSASSFVLLGVNVPTYSPTVSYNATTQRGEIVLASPINVDKLRIGVASSVTDAAGNALDGDANGSAGGALNYRFNVLVGDGNNDGSVNGGDLPTFASAFNTSFGNTSYNVRADWNSDGSVNGGDLPFFALNFNQSLPIAEPGNSTFSTNRFNGSPVTEALAGLAIPTNNFGLATNQADRASSSAILFGMVLGSSHDNGLTREVDRVRADLADVAIGPFLEEIDDDGFDQGPLQDNERSDPFRRSRSELAPTSRIGTSQLETELPS